MWIKVIIWVNIFQKLVIGASELFGPLKYIFYLIILSLVGYGILLALPSFVEVEQIEVTTQVTLPTPQLVDEN